MLRTLTAFLPSPQHLARICTFPEGPQPYLEMRNSWEPSDFSGNVCRMSVQCPWLAYNEKWPKSCQPATVLAVSPLKLWKMESFQLTWRGSKDQRVWTLSLAWQLPSMSLARRWLGNPGLTDSHWTSLIKGISVHRPATSGPGACKASWYARWHKQFPVSCCGQRPTPTPSL